MPTWFAKATSKPIELENPVTEPPYLEELLVRIVATFESSSAAYMAYLQAFKAIPRLGCSFQQDCHAARASWHHDLSRAGHQSATVSAGLHQEKRGTTNEQDR